MSYSATAWFYGECEERGSAGWVLSALCYAADADGLAALSKRTLARETRMSEPAIVRALDYLVSRGLVADVEPALAPEWWHAIRADRRPRLLKLVAFTGSRFGPPSSAACAQRPVDTVDNGGAGSRRGHVRGGNGVTTGARVTPSDQPRENAIHDQEMTHERAGAAQSVEKRAPHPDCPTCHGKGEHYNAVGGFDVACPCTYEPEWKPPGPATRPPVGFGMPAGRAS